MTKREKVIKAWQRNGGNVAITAKELGMARGSIYHYINTEEGLLNRPIASGKIPEIVATKIALPVGKDVKRYILTSAQNNTHIHPKVWENLIALKNYYDAELLVGTFTYNQNAYGKMSVKLGKEHDHDQDLWYAQEVLPYIRDERVELAPGLQWCGEMNILPTAVDPLSGFENYTGLSSGIFPQAKFAMRSVAAGSRHTMAKFTYTTGACTKRNYIQKRAGLKAEHHHGYGALVVEVNSAGEWWVRQLGADKHGVIHDFDLVAKDGYVKGGQQEVEAIIWGDIHTLLLDPKVAEGAWGKSGMLECLRPNKQFIHDVMLGAVTNHWERKNTHERFRRMCKGGGWNNLGEELKGCVSFLEQCDRKWVETVIVDSNHDRPWLESWLRDTDGRQDPRNVILWLKLSLASYEAIEADPEDRDSFHILEHALRLQGLSESFRFLRSDESFCITPLNIECGMHGHLGPNGSRGAPQNLARISQRANTAHTHSAGIWDGLYIAGMSCQPDMGYNRGPSSWSQSHVVTYANGKRTMITMRNGKWRA